jgi:hypothetical protein
MKKMILSTFIIKKQAETTFQLCVIGYLLIFSKNNFLLFSGNTIFAADFLWKINRKVFALFDFLLSSEKKQRGT